MNKSELHNFTATLTHNTREKRLNDKHILMLDIHYADTGELFRDHCWVCFSDMLKQFQPKTNRYKISITFKARLQEYSSINGMQYSLVDITDMHRIKRKQHAN